ncbi:MAG: hypothetical protein KJP07_19155 [Desulfatitalea sp.]|nr:hypothetical protein [Desulfatitalea sp.]
MLTIAWDVDDVLNHLMKAWLEDWWKVQYPNCSLDYQQIHINPPHRLINASLDEYLLSLDDYRLSGQYAKMSPNPAVSAWFKSHGTSFRHLALSAVSRPAAHVSASWVITHFGDWIRSFHFVPSYRRGDISTHYESTKAEYLKRLGQVDFFIDDSAENVRDASAVGVKSFLVSRPWNTGGMALSDILNVLEK